MSLDFSIVPPFLGTLFEGAMWTFFLTVLSIIFSLIFGTFFAVMQLSRFRWFKYFTRFFVWIFMGTPLLLQVYLIYFGLVQIGLNLNAFTAGVIALSLHFSVYNSDIIRSGILAVDKGHFEASRSLGLSNSQTMRKIVVPQALHMVMPALGNMMIALLKESSLISIIGVMELTLSAQRAISETFQPFEFYMTAAAIYYMFNLMLEGAIKNVETRSAKYR